MNYWEVLGIPETDDIHIIKKAYAQKSKLYHPETHPEEFKQLHTAYKALLSGIKNKEFATPVSARNGVPSQGKVPEIFPSLNKKETTTAEVGKAQPVAPSHTPEQKTYLREETSDKQEKYKTDIAFLAQIEKLGSKNEVNIYDDPMILRLQSMVKDKKYIYNPPAWRQYFLCHDFLIRQYHPDFINAMAAIVEKKIRSTAVTKNIADRILPPYFLFYVIITYGCMFERIGLIDTIEHVYKKELLTSLKNAFQIYSPFIAANYLTMEDWDHLLGERFAFYAYRSILELLEFEHPNKATLKQWLCDGFDKINTSHVLEIMHFQSNTGMPIGDTYRKKNRIINSPVFYELMAFLLSSNHINSAVFEDVLEEVCEMYAEEEEHREEREILLLMIEENRGRRK